MSVVKEAYVHMGCVIMLNEAIRDSSLHGYVKKCIVC